MTRKFWFRFDIPASELPIGVGLGCGVNARSLELALEMVRERVFAGPLPALSVVIEDVEISSLDEEHVLPNLGDVFAEGVWFPKGYEKPYV